MILERSDFLLLAPERIHREASRIRALAADDARRVGLLGAETARFDAFNALGPYVYPAAPLERALFCAAWSNWLFFFDDAHDDGDPELDPTTTAAQIEAYLAVLGDGATPLVTDPLSVAIAEFRERALALGGATWLERFTASARDYLLRGTLNACVNRRDRVTPRLDSYLEQREHDSAVHTSFVLLELASDLRLRDDEWNDPDVVALTRAGVRTVALFNDIASYPKEVLRDGSPNNLVHVLASEGRSYGRALADAVDLVNGYASQALSCAGRIDARFDREHSDVPRFADGVLAWQRGNVEWSLREARYRASASPFAELRR